ncbi:C1 family peptidase [Mesorhizobium sp. LSJC264A00]|uniref:C1 family peptidase n=1 Tax=unclassified Mesorhizobium TaxID=325217 RepID=UPI0003CF41CE|nr:C1 family peptidase [Mesorhizobium sp. LSJC264A00]ESX24391.1 peptidase C1 [Mesorhizobium sp. LSJC264A00]
MATLSLEKVKSLLKNKRKYRWEAGETSVSHLAEQAAPGMAHFGIGASADELAVNETMAMMAAAAPCSPPKSLDWRNKGGQNFVTAVRNQLNCGACVAFSTCAAIEARDAVKKKTPNPQLDLSEAHLFFCGCGNCCSTGWQPPQAMLFATSFGIGIESGFPYTPANQPCKPKIKSVLKLKSSSIATSPIDRKCALFLGGPVVAAMKVFRDFTYYKGGVYKPVSNELLGLHAICVIGYDDVGKYWIIKNSWGTGWGSGGFGRIAYGTTCGIDGQFPFWVPEL